MHYYMGAAAAALLVAACDSSAGGKAANAAAPAKPAAKPAARPAASPPVPPRQGYSWYFKDDGDGPMALYGRVDADSELVLRCMPGGVFVQLDNVSSQRGLEQVTLNAGGATGTASTAINEEGIPSLNFSLPVNTPAVANMATHGFRLRFSNGKGGAYPPDPKADRRLPDGEECSAEHGRWRVSRIGGDGHSHR